MDWVTRRATGGLSSLVLGLHRSRPRWTLCLESGNFPELKLYLASTTDEDDCVQKCNVIAECNVICMREHPGITIRRYHHHPGLSLLERSPARPSTLAKLASRKA